MPIPEGASDVTDAETLTQAQSHLATVKELAVDVEADSMHHFLARLCFVQVGTDEQIFLLDTLVAEVRPDALAQVFSNPNVTKFFHAAGGDLQFLAEAGVRVKGLFDTHRAATLLGWPKVGLADLVLDKLGKTLNKEHQQADFSLRPLPPAMRAYIADDVRYLVEVGRMVRQACVEADVLEEVLLDCDRLAEEAAERPDVAVEYRLKLPKQGLSNAEQRMAEVVGLRLHHKRLQWAQAADLPMGRMLSNAAIGSIATRFPKALKELSRLEGVRGAFAKQYGEEVLAMVRDVIEQNRLGTLPPAAERKETDRNQRRRSDVLVAWRKEKAVARKLTPSAVLPNSLVEDLAAAAPASLEALAGLRWFGPKRVALYGEEILATLKKG